LNLFGKLAARLAVRYTDLLNVPRPNSGYWGCIHRGQTVKKAPLSPESPLDSVKIPTKALRKKKRKVATTAQEGLQPKASQKYLPVVARIRDSLVHTSDSAYGLCSINCGKKGIHIDVAHGSIERVLRMCDAIFRGCKEQGIRVRDQDDLWKVAFAFDQEEFCEFP
jgi:hypothetical protein